MHHKDFLESLRFRIETRLDYLVPRWEARVERRGAFSKLMKSGLSEVWRAQYENDPTKVEKPDGL